VILRLGPCLLASKPSTRVDARFLHGFYIGKSAEFRERAEVLDFGGERGIRTLEGLLTLTPLAGVRLRPLGHLSGPAKKDRHHTATGRGLLSSSRASRYRADAAHRPMSLGAILARAASSRTLSTAFATRCRYCSRDHSPGSCPARSRSRSRAASAASGTW
jgi:hypothetical protein